MYFLLYLLLFVGHCWRRTSASMAVEGDMEKPLMLSHYNWKRDSMIQGGTLMTGMTSSQALGFFVTDA